MNWVTHVKFIICSSGRHVWINQSVGDEETFNNKMAKGDVFIWPL